MLEIKEINKNKSIICENILRGLPEWFGIEDALRMYAEESANMPMYVALSNDHAIGFISIKNHFPKSAEVYVMGVNRDFHTQGIGTKLLKFAEIELRKNGTEFLQVKTLSENRPNQFYDKTRKFYLKNGFVPLEEFKTLWGDANPCLLLIKNINLL